MAELEVNGKKLTARDRFPAKSFYPLYDAIRWYGAGHALGERTFEQDVAPYVGTVTKWDFGGDPNTLDGWADLDIMTELPQIIGAVNNHIIATFERAGTEAKN
jgi:hypothetical protein